MSASVQRRIPRDRTTGTSAHTPSSSGRSNSISHGSPSHLQVAHPIILGRLSGRWRQAPDRAPLTRENRPKSNRSRRIRLRSLPVDSRHFWLSSGRDVGWTAARLGRRKGIRKEFRTWTVCGRQLGLTNQGARLPHCEDSAHVPPVGP